GVDYPMAQAYAGGLVAQRCIEIAGTLDQRALRQVASTLDFTTFYGRYRIEPRTGRQLGHRMPVIQWQGDRKVVVWPMKGGLQGMLILVLQGVPWFVGATSYAKRPQTMYKGSCSKQVRQQPCRCLTEFHACSGRVGLSTKMPLWSSTTEILSALNTCVRWSM